MANVVTKHSISSELAQKMVDAAVAKARDLGVRENVAILDDGGNLKGFFRGKVRTLSVSALSPAAALGYPAGRVPLG